MNILTQMNLLTDKQLTFLLVVVLVFTIIWLVDDCIKKYYEFQSKKWTKKEIFYQKWVDMEAQAVKELIDEIEQTKASDTNKSGKYTIELAEPVYVKSAIRVALERLARDSNNNQ